MMYRSPVVDPKIEGFLGLSPADSGLSNFMDSFNREYKNIVEGPGSSGGLRNSGARNQSQCSDTNLKMGSSPFTNDLLKSTMQYNQFENLNGSAIKSL
jgi:hypothetical protein